MSGRAQGASRPRASVIIPTYNDTEALELTLTGFAQQTCDRGHFEVVLIDDGSTHDLRPLVARFQDACQIHHLRQENQGRASARNRGIAAARGSIIIFCDADAVPAPGFVEHHCACHDGQPDAVVIGLKRETLTEWRASMDLDALLPLLGPDVLPELRALAQRAARGEEVRFLAAAEVAAGMRHFDVCTFHEWGNDLESVCDLDQCVLSWVIFTTRNASVSRALLERTGPFDETFRGWGFEDTDLGRRLGQHGGRYIYNDQAINYHQAHRAAHEFIAMGEDIIRNYRYFRRKHPDYSTVLYWRYLEGLMSPREYHELVLAYRDRSARGHEPLLADYWRACEQLAESWTPLPRPYALVVYRQMLMSRVPE